MPPRESALISAARGLSEATAHLRAELLVFKRACDAMVKGSTPGQPASTTIEMMERLKVAERRVRVTSAIDEFEAARRLVRMELIAASQDQGRNLSDVARVLGVSRQLTSKLGAEARERKG